MPQFDFNMGTTRTVSRKASQGVIGAPPPPSASARASAARYEGSAKQASDMAAISKREAQSERLRRAGRMSSRRQTFPQIGPPPPAPGGGGGGGGSAALEPSNGAQEDWWMNPLVWAGALGALLLFRRKK